MTTTSVLWNAQISRLLRLEVITDIESGLAFLKISYPVIVRPAYTLGGTGGGIAEDPEQLETILSEFAHFQVGQVLT